MTISADQKLCDKEPSLMFCGHPESCVREVNGQNTCQWCKDLLSLNNEISYQRSEVDRLKKLLGTIEKVIRITCGD